MNGTIRLAKKCSSFAIYVINFFTSNCLTYSPHGVLVVYPTSHQRSLEHIAQQLMLVQNLITCKYEYNGRQITRYTHASVRKPKS